MSGTKRSPIQILREQLEVISQRLKVAETQKGKLSEKLNELDKKNQQNVQRFTRILQKRSDQYNKVLAGLKTDLKEVAKNHEKAIQTQNENFLRIQREQRSQNLENILSLRDWTSHHMEKQREEFRKLYRKNDQKLSEIKSMISKMAIVDSRKSEYAKDFIEDLQKLIEDAEIELPHEKYAEGKLDKVRRKLDAANQHLNMDFSEAAIATSQEAFSDYLDLREEILRQDREYEVIHAQTLDYFKTLLENIRSNRKVQLSADSAYCEVNYWTNGQYHELESEVEEVKSRLENEKNRLSLEEVEKLNDEIINLEKRQFALIDDALERVSSSQIRAEMGDSVISSLKENGFKFMEGGYESGDQRKTYVIKLQNPKGTEIVAVIAPEEESHKNTLSVNTYGEDFLDDESKMIRFEEIKSSLESFGISMGEIESEKKGIEEFRDVEQILEKGVPEKGLEKAKMINSQTRPGLSK